jgi:hypothetical protein
MWPIDISVAVRGGDGRVVVGPMTVVRGCVRLLPTFCGDLNGDGRADFVLMAQVADAWQWPACDVVFALSSKDGHRITVMRRNLKPGARDFVDLGGRCGFIHTEFVDDCGSCEAKGHAVRRLFEFRPEGGIAASPSNGFPETIHLAAAVDSPPPGTARCSAAAPSPELPPQLVDRSHPVATTVAQRNID